MSYGHSGPWDLLYIVLSYGEDQAGLRVEVLELGGLGGLGGRGGRGGPPPPHMVSVSTSLNSGRLCWRWLKCRVDTLAR